MTVIVVALAAYRVVRAWFWEDIGEPFRTRVDEYTSTPSVKNRIIRIRRTRIRQWFGDLFGCPYCLSFWITLVLTVMYRHRHLRRLVEALAGATIVAAALDHYPDPSRDVPEEHEADT